MLTFFNSLWRSHRAKIALSLFCVLIALFDTFWKSLSPIAAGALAVAVIPWVIQLIERISAPGGFEVVFSKAEQQLREALAVPDAEDISAFKYFESRDPNLAIALLRVEIERRLRQIAEEVMLEPDARGRPRGLRELTDALHDRELISKDAFVLLRDLMPVMNEAVHGVDVGSRGAEFALNYGPRVLSLLRKPNN